MQAFPEKAHRCVLLGIIRRGYIADCEGNQVLSLHRTTFIPTVLEVCVDIATPEGLNCGGWQMLVVIWTRL